jgi:hypothetical protein
MGVQKLMTKDGGDSMSEPAVVNKSTQELLKRFI